jgi:hypothetical protein
MANAQISTALRTNFLGLQFPSPIGVGAGIDLNGRAAPLIQELGVGFVELGPLGLKAGSRRDCQRLRRTRAVAFGGAEGGPMIDEGKQNGSVLSIPIGVRLRAHDLVESICQLPSSVQFVTIPAGAGQSRELLKRARAATDLPLLLRVLAGGPQIEIEGSIENALAVGLNGVQVVAAGPYPELEEGELIWRGALPEALALVARLTPTLPVALAGGVATPADAEAALVAGAGLIFLSDGLIFAGPGLPKRINRHLTRALQNGAGDRNGAGSLPGVISETAKPERPSAAAGSQQVEGRESATRARSRAAGCVLLTGMALMTALAGLVYLVLAATSSLLPPETAHLGQSLSSLCGPDECRIPHFINHGRACYAGALMAVGAIWAWLVIGPLKRQEPWAWWTLLFAGTALYVGYLDFIAYGYMEPWDSAFTLVLMICWIVGLVLTRPGRQEGLISSFRRPGAQAWRWSPGGRGRALLLLFGAGLIVAGLSIVTIAGSDVFVPQDLAFLHRDPQQLKDLNSHLISLMAHDRAGFGACMLALGITFLCASWKAIRPQGKGAWWVLGLSGAALILPAFMAHLLVGYTSIVHLSPIYAGSILLVMALFILRAPIWEGAGDVQSFPDY